MARRQRTVNTFHPEHHLDLLIYGFAFSEAIYAATRLGLFTYLANRPGRTMTDIRSALRIPENSARVLLMACCSLNLIKKNRTRGTYSNHPVATALFGEGSPYNVRPILEANHSLIYRPMNHLLESLKKGTNTGLKEFPGKGNTLYERLSGHRDNETIFHAWMRGIAKYITDELEDVYLPALDPTIGKMRHLMDVGGADGTHAIRMCQRYPRLKITIFDLPSICRRAKKNIAKHGLSDRISIHPGNFVKDRFTSGMDGIYFSHIFNIYSPKTNLKLMKKSFDALKPGGSLMIFNSVSNDDETGDMGAAALSLYFHCLATGEGMVYPAATYSAWLKTAGFSRRSILRFERQARAIIIGKK